jgi:hypothetical protein
VAVRPAITDCTGGRESVSRHAPEHLVPLPKGAPASVTIASSDWPSNWLNVKPADNEIRFTSPDGSDAEVTEGKIP